MSKKNLECLGCQSPLSKSEAQFVDEDTFQFLTKLPEGITIGSYCNQCFDNRVGPQMDNYNEKMDRAKNVNVFYLSQSKESRFVRRTEKPIKVENCADRDEVVLRLAFIAIEANKNSIIDVDFSSVKVMDGRWQTTRWSGRAIPAEIDPVQLQRRFPGTPN